MAVFYPLFSLLLELERVLLVPLARGGSPSLSALLRIAPAIAEVAAAPITAGVIQSLRRQWGSEAAATIVAIAAEQPRAREKFGPGLWMVTPRAIQQATDRIVARYKASLLGDRPVLDLCGGLGGDAMELARRGPLATVDLDPKLTAMAAANLRLDRELALSGNGPIAAAGGASIGGAVAICADVQRYPIRGWPAIHIDPDRRPEQRRTTRPADYLPPLHFVQSLVEASQAAIIKLAPAAVLGGDAGGQSLVQHGHRQWISLDQSVREQTLLCGEAIAAAGVRVGGRSAVRLLRSGPLQRFAIDAPTAARLDELDRSLPATETPQGLVLDFDPAVRAAGLTAPLALAHGLRALGGPAGFMTADALLEDLSLMQCFETVWSGAADRKQIRSALRRHDLVVQSVKVRGGDHDPAHWLRALRCEKAKSPDDARSPDRQVTLLIGRHARGTYAVLGKRIER